MQKHNSGLSKGFSRRLNYLRQKNGLTKQDLASKVGVSLTTIQQYETGQMPKSEYAIRIAQVLNCSLDWLLAGVGTDTSPTWVKGDDSSSFHEGTVWVPMVEPRVSENGEFEVNSNSVRHYAFRHDFLARKGNVSEMVLLRASGDSMEPHIVNNDAVLIDQSQKAPKPGHIYVINIEGMVYFKVLNASPGNLIFSSFNTKYESVVVSVKSNIIRIPFIIGRAVWLGRELY